jgi:hypothetical protein
MGGTLFGQPYGGPLRVSTTPTQFGIPTPAAPAPQAMPSAGPQAPIPPAAPVVNPEQPSLTPGDRPPTQTEMAQSLLARNADGSMVDPTSAQLSALQNTYVLPNGQVISAEQAAAIQAAGSSPGGMYQKHFKSASEDYLKGDTSKELVGKQVESLKNQSDAVTRIGAQAAAQAEREVAATDGYLGVIRGQEQLRMAQQQEADKQFKQYQKDMAQARKDYDVALSGGTTGEKAVRGGGMLFGSLAAGIAGAFNASASIRSRGAFRGADAAQLIDSMLERDMRAQDKRVAGAGAKLTQVQQMYQDFRTKFKDDEAARQATMAVSKDILAGQLSKYAATLKGTQAAEQAKMQSEELRQQGLAHQDQANKLLAQVIDQNTHLLQSPGRQGAALPTAMEKAMEQTKFREQLRAANAPYSGQGGTPGALTEGGKARVQKANEETAGYAAVAQATEALQGPASPLNETDRALRAMEGGIIPEDVTMFGLPTAVNAIGSAAAYPYAAITGQSVQSAKTLRQQEQLALQPLRIAITGAGAGQQELEHLEKLIASPGSNDQKKAQYGEAEKFAADFIAKKAPPDPAERAAYLQNLQAQGVPATVIRAVQGKNPANDAKNDARFMK